MKRLKNLARTVLWRVVDDLELSEQIDTDEQYDANQRSLNITNHGLTYKEVLEMTKMRIAGERKLRPDISQIRVRRVKPPLIPNVYLNFEIRIQIFTENIYIQFVPTRFFLTTIEGLVEEFSVEAHFQTRMKSLAYPDSGGVPYLTPGEAQAAFELNKDAGKETE